MATLIVRTDEPLDNIRLRGNSGDWILTDPRKIAALEAGGILEVHPLKRGDPYTRVLRAEVVSVTPLTAQPQRRQVHFTNAVWIPPATRYSSSWVVKFIP